MDATPLPARSLPPPPPEEVEDLPVSDLTIKVFDHSSSDLSLPISPSISKSPNLCSPSTVSPLSSAFVSALQSPYISPRALDAPPDTNTTTASTTATLTSPISYSGSHSDDVPGTSYTPSSEIDDFPPDPNDQKLRFSDASQPRISFSFPVPRISLSKSSIPPANAKLRSCDVYIGFHGQNVNLIRFCKWLKAELELQGIVSFVADRAKYSNTQSHEIADRIICSAAFGVVVVTASSFLNPHSIKEIRFFAQKKNLVPLLFDTDQAEIIRHLERNPNEKEWKEAFEGISKLNEFKLEANEANWRNCVAMAVEILKGKLGRKNTNDNEIEEVEEIPFPRNKYFVGREKELTEMEAAFFGCCDVQEIACLRPMPSNAGCSSGLSDGFADGESDTVRVNGRYISLEMKNCKEPTPEAWIEPTVELTTSKTRGLQKQRSKHKKPRWSSNKSHGDTNAICITGISGIGKTELVVEFAHRYSQRYKMVLWVGGEARYFWQNILNLSTKLGLDVSAESEKERGRIRSFDEQEYEAFQRVKRELFRDVPYLLVIDNLETEKEWWEGKDLHDLIPSNTGATHVIVTTRLNKVMSLESMHLPPLSLADSLILIRGRHKKNYNDNELEILKKFDEKLGRLSYGLWLIGSLLSELDISPSELFEAIDGTSLDISYSFNSCDDGFYGSNSFLMKVLFFCFSLLDQKSGRRNLAHRMVLAGAWFSPAPISSTLLAGAANKIHVKSNKFALWKKCLGLSLCSCPKCWLNSQARRNEMDSAIILVKLGLAKRTSRLQGYSIQFHPITQHFAKQRGGLPSANATAIGLAKLGKPMLSPEHFWASAFLVFGFKSQPPLVQLKAIDMVRFIKKAAIPLAIQSFMTFSRCSSALELLKDCTDVLEEVEKSFVSQMQDWQNGAFCWRKKLKSNQMLDEYIWRDVTLLKALLLETRAKLLLRGGHFDSAEELCRTCISIRTVIFGHNHAQTLAAQQTLAKLVKMRSKI